MPPRQIARFVIGFCCALPAGIGFFGIGLAIAFSLLLGIFVFVANVAETNPWLTVMIANLLGVMLPRIIRQCRKMHPVATLKHEMTHRDTGGTVSGLMMGAVLGMGVILMVMLNGDE